MLCWILAIATPLLLDGSSSWWPRALWRRVRSWSPPEGLVWRDRGTLMLVPMGASPTAGNIGRVQHRRGSPAGPGRLLARERRLLRIPRGRPDANRTHLAVTWDAVAKVGRVVRSEPPHPRGALRDIHPARATHGTWRQCLRRRGRRGAPVQASAAMHEGCRSHHTETAPIGD